ncbi:solute carrier family 40 member 1-like [Antedon mediterranea]|uniref:solute carrier family 40 member 1-like n=1 Tax=Antedon mediterranea TaxID=105859 RepID=UPI003AF61D4C
MDENNQKGTANDIWLKRSDLQQEDDATENTALNEEEGPEEEGPWYRRPGFKVVEQGVEPDAADGAGHDDNVESVASSGRCSNLQDWLHSNAFLIYCSQALSSWGDRMWSFGVALYLVQFEDGLLRLTSIFGLARTISVLLFGAIVGEWVDRTPRLRATRMSLIIQNSSVMICALFLLFFLLFESWLKDQLGGALAIITLGVIIVIGCIADIASVALKICIQKDWVVVIAGGDGARLAEINSVIRRIDLLANILAPILVGCIMTSLSLEIAAMFLAGWNLVSMFVEYFQLHRVYKAVPQLAVKQVKTNQGDYNPINCVENSDLPPGNSGNVSRQRSEEQKPFLWRITQWFTSTYQGFKTYNSYQVAWAGISLSFLYMTVLGFDAVSSGYGYSQGLSGTVLGVFMGLGSVMGVLGTIVYPIVQKRLGVVRTGIYANAEQVLCLMLCVASIYAPGSSFDLGYRRRPPVPTDEPMYYTDPYNNITSSNMLESDYNQHSYWSVGLLFAGMILSRTGLWMFDLTVTQLLQENVAESERGVVGGIQNSLNCFMDMLHFVVVIIAPQPESFGVLIFISVMFVTMAGILYSAYVYRVRGHLFHPEKLIPCKNMVQSDLRTDKTSNGYSDANKRSNGEPV